MQNHESLRSLTDNELLGRLSALARLSRRVEAELIAHLGEVDARRLYLREAAPSMFVYATRVLHLSEAEAYLRITVARAAREHPALLARLGSGELHLSGAALLAQHLTVETREALLARAAHKSKRQIQELVAELTPRPDVPALIRKLPDPPAGAAMPPTARTQGSDSARLRLDADRATEAATVELCPDRVGATATQSPRLETGTSDLADERMGALRQGPGSRGSDILQPLARARYRVQVTAGEALRDKLERLQALLPGSDLATLVEQAVTEKLERLEARRFGRTKAPRKSLAEADTSAGPRTIPAPVRRAVYERAGGRCAFVDARGRRCEEQSRLEFHHRHPHGHGGERTPDNISLLCKSHNLYLAEIDYGRAAIARRRRGSGRAIDRPSGSLRQSPNPGR
jgi:hypothetical protein